MRSIVFQSGLLWGNIQVFREWLSVKEAREGSQGEEHGTKHQPVTEEPVYLS